MKKIGMSLLAVAGCAAFAVAGVMAKPADEKVNGWVVDAKCSANAKMLGDVECAKKCAAGGSPLVIVSDKDQHVYKVDNQAALAAHAGHHVSVTGAVTGDSIHVDKVTMLSQTKPM